MRIALVITVALAACRHGASPTPPPPADDSDANPAVTDEDRTILARADALLASEAVWNRHDTRDCPAGETRWSLFCALHDATIEVLGRYDHRRAALQQVRFVVDERKRDYPHRLMGFNNDPSTTFADIKAVLHLARERSDTLRPPRPR